MTEQVPLTTEEASITAKRILSDADLIKGKADIAPSGTLRPTDAQIISIHSREIEEPKIKEFLHTTPEGRLLSQQIGEVLEFKSALGGSMGHAQIQLPGTTHFSRPSDFREFGEANDLGLNFDKLEEERENRKGWCPYTSQVYEINFRAPLEELTRELVNHPEYRFGSLVNIKTTSADGNTGPLEGGWQIDRIMANGKLVAAPIDGRDMSQAVTISELNAWNQPPTND